MMQVKCKRKNNLIPRVKMKQVERQVPKIKHSHQAYSKSLNASD